MVAAVFGCVAENVIQNTSTNYERIFYATLVIAYYVYTRVASYADAWIEMSPFRELYHGRRLSHPTRM
ncbi:hypothetical protein, partial [Priestia endophytica]|uniref:hypothetical protein n=1 Tax=Priestia endophytica TaxID=135735 RepID=UPI002E1F9B95|nr:hypothetical protein [Priestia endophytica]